MHSERDISVQVSESVIVAAVKQSGFSAVNNIRLLLERDGGLGVTEVMIRAVHDPKVLEVLLNHRPICLITPEMVIAASPIKEKCTHLEERNGEFTVIWIRRGKR